MATACFDRSVAMGELFNNCGCGCPVLLINWSFTSLRIELDSALCYLVRLNANFQFLILLAGILKGLIFIIHTHL